MRASAEHDIPVPAGPQLPALRHRPAGQAGRRVDDVHRPGLARARALRQLAGRARHRHRAAVPAGPAAHAVGRQAGRPVRQAQAAGAAPTPRSRSPRSSSPSWSPAGVVRALARVRVRRAARHRERHRDPGPAGVRLRTGGAAACCRTRWRSRRPPSTPPGSAARRWPAWPLALLRHRTGLPDRHRARDRAGVQLHRDARRRPATAPERPVVEGRHQDRRRPAVRLEATRPAAADRA